MGKPKKRRKHPCKGCVWGRKVLDRIFCPFPSCVRAKPDNKKTNTKG